MLGLMIIIIMADFNKLIMEQIRMRVKTMTKLESFLAGYLLVALIVLSIIVIKLSHSG